MEGAPAHHIVMEAFEAKDVASGVHCSLHLLNMFLNLPHKYYGKGLWVPRCMHSSQKLSKLLRGFEASCDGVSRKPSFFT